MSEDIDPVHSRSLLFVPGDRPERFDKAVATGADCVILDLEDAVAPEAKQDALRHVLDWLERGGRAVVRVNATDTAWHDDEIAALAPTHASIMVPKSQSAAATAAITDRIGDGRLIALIETAVGVRDVDAVAGAPGVIRLALGNVDLSAELGTDHASHEAMAYARGRLVMASAAAGLVRPVDGVTTSLHDATVLAADLAVTRQLGFGGKLCIHPRQVQAVNGALQPSETETAWAERVLEAAGLGGVAVVDGSMIDAPVVDRARAILAIAASFAQVEG